MLQNISIFNTIFNDAPQPWQLGFQDSAAPGLTGIVELHNTIFFYLIVIVVGVFWVLGSIIYYYNSKKSQIVHKYLNHGTLIELIWTITPAFILIAIAFPSFRLLYLLDEVISPTITIKVVGHQWYWSYEYYTHLPRQFFGLFDLSVFDNNYVDTSLNLASIDYFPVETNKLAYESIMVQEEDLKYGSFRLLEVDKPLYLPVNVPIRVIVSSDDVLHS